MEIIGDFDDSSFSTIVKTQVSQKWMQEIMEVNMGNSFKEFCCKRKWKNQYILQSEMS